MQTKIGLHEIHDDKGESISVELKINDILVMTFPDAGLSMHPMDELLTVVGNDNRILAEFPESFNAGFESNKYDFDFDTNFVF